ncbi:ABC transporter permease [Diaphorobacter ruginosibacter]|uniref:ABC transporter permease n=1 Tax=Diaphorobacter ruginosibacter TaxID=1715720 RepID=A0A7G9RPP5_9BURK|nr:ABC transporter permease [Diaphorobacter ruginosibacter]MDR2333146.1 ABC transporter permease [Burkholderiaceae bacterium]QNN57570.1 ABC transporter permease [Diaphorobacter ruginosibacter]
MIGFIFRRLAQSVVVLWLMSVVVFAGIFIVGDPTAMMIPDSVTPEMRAQMVAALGLDRSPLHQYWDFVLQLLQGSLGRSFATGLPVAELIGSRLTATMELAVTAMIIAIVVGLPLGLLAGLYPERLPGRVITTLSSIGFSLPTFWVGLMLIMVFAVLLGWLPSNGRGPTSSFLGLQVSFLSWDGLKYLLLPALNLAIFNAAMIIRLTRSSTREAMLLDYVKFARAKGLSERRVVCVHVLKNILIPIITVIGINFGGIIAFSVVTETIFGWPGMGKLLIDSINALDRPVVLGYLMFVVVMYLVINLIVDILYSVLDPRIVLGDSQ